MHRGQTHCSESLHSFFTLLVDVHSSTVFDLYIIVGDGCIVSAYFLRGYLSSARAVAQSGHVQDTSVQVRVHHMETPTTSHLMARDLDFQGLVSTFLLQIFVMDITAPSEYRPLMSPVDPQASHVPRKSPLPLETLLSS